MHKFIRKNIKDFDKKTLAVYFLLRFFVIVVMIIQIFRSNWEGVFVCFLTLFLLTPPFAITSFKTSLT